MTTMLWCYFLIISAWLLHNVAAAAMCRTGYDLQRVCFDCCYGTPLNEYKDIQSVLSCSTLCSEDLECRSWQFNTETKECWTNAETMSRVKTSCINRVRYGETQQANCRQPRMYDPCRSDADCPIVNSTCRGGNCDCKDGHPYDTRTDSCPTGCRQYGQTLHETSYYLVGVGVDDILLGTFEQCQSRCLTVTHFECRLLSYNILQNYCTLDQYNALDHPEKVVKTNVDSRWKSWDRNCA